MAAVAVEQELSAVSVEALPFSARSIFLTVPAGFAVYLVAIFVLRAVERDEYELAA